MISVIFTSGYHLDEKSIERMNDEVLEQGLAYTGHLGERTPYQTIKTSECADLTKE